LQKLQDGLSFICDASDGLFPFKTYSEGENPNESEISVKTKTVNRELNVSSLTALHVLGKSLVETIELKENNSI
jgi:hypothetical protein